MENPKEKLNAIFKGCGGDLRRKSNNGDSVKERVELLSWQEYYMSLTPEQIKEIHERARNSFMQGCR